MAGFIKKQLSFTELQAVFTKLGRDNHILIYGGESHIGCAVLAVPRPSLADENQVSCTSSVLNVTGHKDEQVCRFLAESVCKNTNAVTVCCGGIHKDNITEDQLRELMGSVRSLAEEIILKIEKENAL